MLYFTSSDIQILWYNIFRQNFTKKITIILIQHRNGYNNNFHYVKIRIPNYKNNFLGFWSHKWGRLNPSLEKIKKIWGITCRLVSPPIKNMEAGCCRFRPLYCWRGCVWGRRKDVLIALNVLIHSTLLRT